MSSEAHNMYVGRFTVSEMTLSGESDGSMDIGPILDDYGMVDRYLNWSPPPAVPATPWPAPQPAPRLDPRSPQALHRLYVTHRREKIWRAERERLAQQPASTAPAGIVARPVPPAAIPAAFALPPLSASVAAAASSPAPLLVGQGADRPSSVDTTKMFASAYGFPGGRDSDSDSDSE